MEIKITGTTEEIKELFRTDESSREQLIKLNSKKIIDHTMETLRSFSFELC